MSPSLLDRLRIHVLTDRELAKGRDEGSVAEAALRGGATVIQLRAKELSTAEMVRVGSLLRRVTQEFGAFLIVNDRVDVALAIGADGAHVGQDDLPAYLARQLLGSRRLLGVSVRSVAEAITAVDDGADYLGVGPIYPTSTKSDAAPAVGTTTLAQIRAAVAVPLIAIGGITAARAPELRAAGADGLAVISAVVGVPDSAEATRALSLAFGGPAVADVRRQHE